MRKSVHLLTLLAATAAFAPAQPAGSGRLAARTSPISTGTGIVPGRSARADAPHDLPEVVLHRRVEAIAPGSIPVHERVHRLRTGDPTPVLDDFERLTGFVEAAELPGDMRPSAFHYLANEIWNLLRTDPSVSTPQLARHLADQVLGAEDPVIRDYALQHLGRLKASEVHDLQIKTLSAAATDPQNPSAGTALIALRSLAKRSGDTESSASLHAAVLALAVNPDTLSAPRITAMAMTADMELDGVLPTARTLLSDVNADPRLRLAAIRYLGYFGGPSDSQLLSEFIPTFRNTILINAARAAMSRIKEDA